MGELIWFFGASGAGKATLVNKVADGRFKIPGVNQPIICHESLELGRAQRQSQLEKILGEYTTQKGSVLIKGQSTDLSSTRIPYKMKESHPIVTQRVVFVYTRPSLLSQRTAYRRDGYWPNPNHDFSVESAFQINAVDSLCKILGIKPTIIDNSDSEPQVLPSIELTDLTRE